MGLPIERALEEWSLRVFDPQKGDNSPQADHGRQTILEYIRIGLEWEWIKTYSGDGVFSWCGAFAAWVHNTVKSEIRRKYFASTYRLSEYGRLNPGRKVATKDIVPGDIVVVQGTERKPWGDHITIAMAWDRAMSSLVTVEGNAHGRWPDGSWVEGVVVNQRPRTDIRAAYRPLKEDKA